MNVVVTLLILAKFSETEQAERRGFRNETEVVVRAWYSKDLEIFVIV